MRTALTVIVALTVAFSIAHSQAQTQGPLETKSNPGKNGRIQPPARILSFEARPASIRPGESVTLVWATENPSRLEITGLGRVTPRGSTTVKPAATTTYTLTLTGPAGDAVSTNVKVTVAGTTEVTLTSAAGSGLRPTPRMADGKPDLSGVYDFSGFVPSGAAGAGAAKGGPGAAKGKGGADPAKPAGPELKPGAEQFRVVRGPTEAGPLSNCMPVAGPASFTVPYQFQIIANKDYVVILHEYPNTHRIIPIGGEHPVDPDPTWLGDSVAKWEGDTLVVDTIGYNTKTEIQGFKHTESLHIVERFTRPHADAIEYVATVEDPNVWVRPWTVSRTHGLRRDLAKIGEFICENNKEYQHLFAK